MFTSNKDRDARIDHLQQQRDHLREAIIKLFQANLAGPGITYVIMTHTPHADEAIIKLLQATLAMPSITYVIMTHTLTSRTHIEAQEPMA